MSNNYIIGNSAANSQFLYSPFPEIDLGPIKIREITEDDAPRYYDYMSSPKMAEFITAENTPQELSKALEDLKYWRSLFTNKRSIYWAIALSESNEMIGTAGFNIISFPNNRADISYDLDPAYWGKGYMLKAIKGILKYADHYLQLMRIQATVYVENERSIKLLERCNFANEAVLKKYEIIAGKYCDYFMYARVHD